METASIGGAAHLVNFCGSDTMPGEKLTGTLGHGDVGNENDDNNNNNNTNSNSNSNNNNNNGNGNDHDHDHVNTAASLSGMLRILRLPHGVIGSVLKPCKLNPGFFCPIHSPETFEHFQQKSSFPEVYA